jgi:ADP-heptose:LPS heptosyltransferase
MPSAEPMKFLVLRFSSIGDIVLTTPVLRGLKQQVPGAEVHVATKPQYRFLFDHNPYVDRIFELGDSLPGLAAELKAERYDAVIDLHHNLRTRRLGWAMGPVPTYRFNKLNREKWLFVNLKINRLPNRHIVDRYLETVAPFGVKDDGGGLDYFLPPTDEVPLDTLPETHRRGYLAFAIGGQHETKKLPVERMIELCRVLGRPVVLLGGPEDAANGERITEAVSSGLVFNGCGRFSFNQSASLVRQAERVYTHDTGLMHVAAAFGKPVVSIWGNTVPAFGMYPYRTKFEVWEVNGLPCRPCSKIGHAKCPQGHFRCMKEIVFERGF